MGKIRRERTNGVFLRGDVTTEKIRDVWQDINRFDEKATPAISNQVRFYDSLLWKAGAGFTVPLFLL